MKTSASSSVPPGMLNTITKVRRRHRLMEGAAIGLIAGAIMLVLIGLTVAIDWRFAWTSQVARWIPLLIAMLIGAGTLIVLARKLGRRISLKDEARRIDRTIPALEERWSTVTELSTTKRDTTLKGSPELIAKVAEEASAFEPQVHPETIIPTESLRRPALLCASAAVIFGFSAVGVAGHLGTLLHRFIAPWQPVTLTRLELTDTPQRVLRQSPLDIQATLTGRMPKQASLLIRDEHGAIRTIDMPIKSDVTGAGIAHRVAQVDESFAYQIRAGDAVTDWVSVKPIDRPQLQGIAVRLTWPAYTNRPVSTWDSLPANIRALRGCDFELKFSADQPLTRAVLEVSRDSKATHLPLESPGPQQYRYAAALAETMHFQIVGENEFGLRNNTAECHIEVVDDQPPEVKILESSQHVALNPDETLRIDFEAKDDFGVNQAEIVATTKKEGEEPQETIIPIDLRAQAGAAELKKSVDLDLKQFKLDAKTELSYAVRVRDNRSEATSATPSKDTGASQTAANSAKPTQQPPGNDMTKRNLDIACQSCSASKEVHIEKFSGAYDGKARDKKSIAIDGVLQSLRKAATDALTRTEEAASGLNEAAALDLPRATLTRAALAQTEEGKRLANNLKKESEGSPYAFFGIQTDAIVKGGLDPAAAKLGEALTVQPAKAKLDDAAVSLRWVIATLDELTKQYVSLKEVQKAQDLLQQIKEMHLVFLEDMPKWLKAAGASSPYSRKMLEVDAAFAKAYEEFLRKRRDVYMQLAELLAKHPELQARFLEASKASTTLFRDELMRLKTEQDSLHSLTSLTNDPDASATSWQTRIEKLQVAVTAQASQFSNAAKTWLPADFDAEIKSKLENGANEVSKAAIRATAIAPGGVELEQALAKLDDFEDTVAKVSNSAGRNSSYARNRFEDIDKLRGSLEQTRRFTQLVGERKFGEALSAAQSGLNTETLSAATKIQQEAISLIGLGNEVHEAAKNFDYVLEHEVKTPQSRAVEALQAQTYSPALESQKTAATGLERSVEALDDFIQKAIHRMDEANAKRGPGAPPSGAPSLEALLRSLEEEKRSAMSLGISCQPMNIQVQTDWQQPGGNPAAGAAKAQKRAEAAQANAEAAAREAARAQEQANRRAKELSKQLETALVSHTAPGTATVPSDKNAHWNTVPSELRASLLQERGLTPPKRYENAIRQYFKSIAETPSDGTAPRNPPPAQ
jgi:hypothetical protein